MKLQDREFFRRDVLCVAPDLVGLILVRRLPDGTLLRARITETEAYRGAQDTACHACHGRTKRTEVLYHDGGTIYVYLCYGMHWMLNIVTGHVDEPQAVLIRACADGANGPGKLTKRLQIDKVFNGGDITACPELWIEDDGCASRSKPTPASGIGLCRARGPGAALALEMRRTGGMHMTYTPDTPLEALAGIGPKKAQAFQKLGVATLRDLAGLYPGGTRTGRSFARSRTRSPRGRVHPRRGRGRAARTVCPQRAHAGQGAHRGRHRRAGRDLLQPALP